MRPDKNDRRLAPDRKCQLVMMDVMTGEMDVVYESNALIEAPNWTPDGRWLIYNADGRLWRISIDGLIGPERITTGDVQNLNNDHVITADGKTIYGSANDGHIYAFDIGGSDGRKMTNDDPYWHFLHGVSPDGAALAYVSLVFGDPIRTRITVLKDGVDTHLTDGAHPVDGPEYSPCGTHIWFNAEAADRAQGHAQIYRMNTDGTDVTQFTFDERVNWFPHISPDGQHVVYLSYPEGTLGHPADRAVILRYMSVEGDGFRDLDAFNGGQGTINVNSWAPDSRSIAYVRYPYA